MKKSLKYFLIIAAAILFVGCGSVKKVSKEEFMLGSSMRMEQTLLNATQHQVDSVCVADSLPKIKTWTGTSFTDFETRQVTIKRTYIKRANNKETVYIVIGQKAPYIIEKRISE